MNITLVQFSHGILALSDDVAVHVTHTQAEVDPHPDDLYNPATNFAANQDAIAAERAEVARLKSEADAEYQRQVEATAKAADEAVKAEAEEKDAEDQSAKVVADEASADAAPAVKDKK